MPGLTDTGEAGLLNHTIGSTPWAFPTNVYACWNTADPTDAGLQTAEIGRTLISSGFDAAAARVAQNSAAESVPTAGFSSDANPISHVGLAYDGVTGPYFWSDQLGSSITFTLGETLEIPAGGFILRINPVSTYAIFDAAANAWLDHILATTQWTLSGTPEVRLHTDDPSQTGLLNEFAGGGYAPESYTLDTLDAVPPATRGRNSNLMQFLNSQSDPLRYWTIHRGTDALFGRQQTQRTVPPGSTVDIPINRLEKLVA